MKKGNINKEGGRNEKVEGKVTSLLGKKEEEEEERERERKSSRDVRTSDLRVLKLGRCSPG